MASDPHKIDDPKEAPVEGPSTTLPNGQIPAITATLLVVNVESIEDPAIPLPSVH